MPTFRSISDMGGGENDEDEEEDMLKNIEPVKIDAYTISQNDTSYKIFKRICLVNCCYMVIIYPYYTLCGFPEVTDVMFIVLCVNELIYAIDIIVRFFTQELDESGHS